MRAITFCRKGEKISDFDAHQKVNEFLDSNIESWEVSNHLVIDEFRVRIKEKTINSDDFHFYVEDLNGDTHYFNIDKDGRSHDWVDSQDIWSSLISKLL